MVSRKTKIVATYGPAVAARADLQAVLEAGVDVIRLNMSHGNHDGHERALRDVREISSRLGRTTAVLLDLSGPKIRAAKLEHPIELQESEKVRLINLAVSGGASAAMDGALGSDGGSSPSAEGGRPAAGGAITIPIEGYPGLAEDVRAGEPILLNDGAVELEVTAVRSGVIEGRVVTGGSVESRKGVNFPASNLRTLQIPTAKDWSDLAFGLAAGVDWVALSFVRSAEEIRRLKQHIAVEGANVPVIAKIEKREALAELEGILAAADGIMVARGDLGVETELEEVALRQKEIIRACNRTGKVVITATQMLESMIREASPTRAEVADISNAIFDGTDALMLSGETAVGKHPVKAVSVMARIAERTEGVLDDDRMLQQGPSLPGVPDAVAHAACVTARQIGAAALVCLTRSGLTARLVSRYRPGCPILAVSPNVETVRRLALMWGVRPVHLQEDLDTESLCRGALERVRETGVVKPGSLVVITAGVSTGPLRGQTNLVRVEVL